MKVIDASTPHGACDALTIGNFDGFHLGHLALIKRMQAWGKTTAVVTFKNHPSTILSSHPKKNLLSLRHKLQLFEQAGVSLVVLLEFTQEFAKQEARHFLSTLQKNVSFSHLVLGYDARLGKDRSGDPGKMEQIAKELHFDLEYLPCQFQEGTPISSSHIRALIQAGELEEASSFLGRPYSILSTLVKGQGMGRVLGFQTLNLQVSDLLLPPLGVYAVKVGNRWGVANLGLAPTIRRDETPLLEVHLLDHFEGVPADTLEVSFVRFLREEKKFANISDLKNQISRDVDLVSKIKMV